ncbi:MAG: SusC/RagA family TonB-linked outer membrane protein [Chitinophagaceae bacterium]
MKKVFQLAMILAIVMMATHVFAQERVINGTVTANEGGQPIADVSVVPKGTTGGTVTDANGKFSVRISSTTTEIEFSHSNYVGQTVRIGSGSMNILMTLNASKELNEVVVIGYGDVKRRAITGAVSSANLSAFRESPNVSLLGSLRGTVPGLNVGTSTSAGEDPRFSIRGVNSISGNQSPLIVLDGIIYRGTINEINPNDIESIDVLKDASSAAVYGAQAANGVVLITSKKGKKGDKPIISYSGKYVIREAAKVPEYYNGEEYVKLYLDWDWENTRIGPDYTTMKPNIDVTQYMFPPEKVNWGLKRFTDWWALTTQQGRMYESDFSISGADERTSYYISGSFSNQKDIIINDKYKRVSTRINLENKVTKWLRFGTNTFLSDNNYSGAEPDMYLGYHMPPLAYPYNDDGSLVTNPSGYFYLNPLFPVQIDDFNKSLQINTLNYAVVDLPVKGLSYRVNYANRFSTSRMYYFDPNYSNGLGEAVKRNLHYRDWTLDNIISYNRDFKEHNIGITLLYGREERSAEGDSARGENFANQTLGYNSIESAAVRNAYSDKWDEASLYQMARINYMYANKYLISFLVRRDGFSGFGDNKKFGVFPSVSLGYVLSETKFLKDKIPQITYLKLRGSYGSIGNRTVDRYQTLARVTTRPGYVFGDGSNVVNSQYVSTMANPDLGWETTTGINLGIDFEFLNRRLRGNIEYFNTDTKNLLYNIALPTASGFSTVATNIGKMHNSGFEFQLTSSNIRTKQFQWRTTVNFSTVKNKVVSILGLDLNGDGREDDLVASSLFIGKSLGTIYDHRIVGMYQIGDNDIPSGYKPGYYRLEDRDKDNDVDPADRDFLGRREPAYRVGILNELEYKGLTLRIFINSIQGGKNGYYSENQPNQDGDNIIPPTKNAPKEWDYWTPENPNAEYPALNYLPPIGGNVYRQRNFVRLQDVTLSYNVTASFISKLRIKSLKLFVNGQNLHTWTKWKGFDPEVGAGLREPFETTNPETRGRPLVRSYTFGLNITL